jgi:hypothetical protein
MIKRTDAVSTAKRMNFIDFPLLLNKLSDKFN